ncbi:MAG: protein kinase [Planctomycetota bacterium]|nr:protein kinase [Planctomycetota bacterium]
MIGEGASSLVWRARLEEPWGGRAAGDAVAVKRLRPEWLTDPRARDAFEREARVGLAAHAEGLLEVLAGGEDEQGPWIVSDLVGGRDLAEVLADTGALPEPLVRRIGLRLAGALEALHAAGFLHGDLKPENVRLDGEGNAVLVDLGFAVPIGADEQRRAGSLAYLSPEQVRGARADERSEVFALGLLLYELASGTHPFLTGETSADEAPGRLEAAAFERPSLRAPTLTPFLDLLLSELLRADPGGRPALAEVARRLREEERGEWWRCRLDLGATARRGGRAERTGGRLTPFVGREDLLERLHGVWSEVTGGGAGAVVRLRGEPGAGKSRLMDRFAAEARRSVSPPLYLYTRCPDGAGERPCRPILLLLRRTLRLPARTAPGERERTELERLLPPSEAAALLAALDPASHGATPSSVPVALAAWLEALARSVPAIVFVDDVRRAGAGTLEVLARLAREVDDLPLLLVLGERGGEPWRRARGGGRLERAAEGARRTETLELEPLGEDELALLVADLFHPTVPRARLARVLAERTFGNPGQVVEILRELKVDGELFDHPDGGGLVLRGRPEDLPLPRSVGGLVADALARRSAPERRWLERLAVVGGRIAPEFLRAAWSDATETDLDEVLLRLVADGWLAAAGDRYRFARPALAEGVSDTLGPARRATLHGEVADALAAAAGSPPPLAEGFALAHHLRAADRPEALLEVLEPLLAPLLARGQPGRVHTVCRWGLAALDALPSTTGFAHLRIGLLEAAADAADRLGLGAEQRGWLDRLADLPLDSSTDPEGVGRVYLLHARFAASTARYAAARAMLLNAAERFAEARNAALEGDALRRLALVQAQVGELGEARRLARRAGDLASDERDSARALLALAELDVLDDEIERALGRVDRAVRLARSPGAVATADIQATANLLRARAYRSGGRPRRALASAQRALRQAHQAGERRLEAQALARVGGLLLDVGAGAEAEARLREAIALAVEIEDRNSEAVAAVWLGMLLIERERQCERAALERAVKLAGELSLCRLEAVGLAVLARDDHLRGEARRAREASERAGELVERCGAEAADRALIVGTRISLLIEDGHEDRARALREELERALATSAERIDSPLLRRRRRMMNRRMVEAALSWKGPLQPRQGTGGTAPPRGREKRPDGP